MGSSAAEQATRRRDSKPILRRTVALAVTSSPRWPSRAKYGNSTRSALLHPPRAARCAFRYLHAQSARRHPRSAETHRLSLQKSLMKTVSDLAGRSGKLVAKGALGDG